MSSWNELVSETEEVNLPPVGFSITNNLRTKKVNKRLIAVKVFFAGSKNFAKNTKQRKGTNYIVNVN